MLSLKDILQNIVGTYTPDLTATDFGQIDYVWIISAVLLLILIVQFFKAIRALFSLLFK